MGTSNDIVPVSNLTALKLYLQNLATWNLLIAWLRHKSKLQSERGGDGCEVLSNCCETLLDQGNPSRVFQVCEVFRKWFIICSPPSEFPQPSKDFNPGLLSASPSIYPLCHTSAHSFLFQRITSKSSSLRDMAMLAGGILAFWLQNTTGLSSNCDQFRQANTDSGLSTLMLLGLYI